MYVCGADVILDFRKCQDEKGARMLGGSGIDKMGSNLVETRLNFSTLSFRLSSHLIGKLKIKNDDGTISRGTRASLCSTTISSNNFIAVVYW